MNAQTIFGITCLLWAAILTLSVIKTKGQCFVKHKELCGYMLITALYVIGIMLCTP